MTDSKMKLNPLSAFFQAIMRELRRKLTPKDLEDMLNERNMKAPEVENSEN